MTDLGRPLVFLAQMIETEIETVRDRLYRAFDRVYLFDWYSRNHKRYAYAELFIEATVFKDDISVDSTFWSLTHGTKDSASKFFEQGVDELVSKIAKRSYRTWKITAVGVAMWRSGK